MWLILIGIMMAILPVEIYGIEYLGRLMGENEEIPSNNEKTLSDLAEEFSAWTMIFFALLGCLEKNSLSAKNDLFTRDPLVCVYAFMGTDMLAYEHKGTPRTCASIFQEFFQVPRWALDLKHWH